ncbi:MAG: sigma-70 family RNA polymerase sigma factor [Planctomycetota bacterium]|nr:MAG: sigma-70 family RNA polymerase sigma factor [Planctomycetota bacterium]
MSEWVTTSTILLGLRRFDNKDAWQRFHARFHKPILAFARRMGLSAGEADDCAQETLLEFANAHRAGKYDPERGRLSSWLFGIAYRKALQAREARGRGAAGQTAGANTTFWQSLPDEQSATEWFEREWRRAVFERCLEQVRREVANQTFMAFMMTVCEGRTPDEAAAALGITRGAVYTSKHRVLRRVRELRQELELVA